MAGGDEGSRSQNDCKAIRWSEILWSGVDEGEGSRGRQGGGQGTSVSLAMPAGE